MCGDDQRNENSKRRDENFSISAFLRIITFFIALERSFLESGRCQLSFAPSGDLIRLEFVNISPKIVAEGVQTTCKPAHFGLRFPGDAELQL